jgi:AraC-like DNA-binding protein
VVHPGEVHANQTETGCSFSSIYIAPEVFRATACGLEAQAQPFPFFPDPIVLDDELILAYNAVYHALSSSTCTLERESLMLKMLTTLVARHAQISPKHSKVGKEHCGVNRVRDYVHTYYASNVTLGELARVANLSRFHLNRAFTREVGMPPHAFQMQVRVANAKRLIRNGFSFADVAAATGFADQSHFTRQFKKLMKITPGDYREKQQ